MTFRWLGCCGAREPSCLLLLHAWNYWNGAPLTRGQRSSGILPTHRFCSNSYHSALVRQMRRSPNRVPVGGGNVLYGKSPAYARDPLVSMVATSSGTAAAITNGDIPGRMILRHILAPRTTS